MDSNEAYAIPDTRIQQNTYSYSHNEAYRMIPINRPRISLPLPPYAVNPGLPPLCRSDSNASYSYVDVDTAAAKQQEESGCHENKEEAIYEEVC